MTFVQAKYPGVAAFIQRLSEDEDFMKTFIQDHYDPVLTTIKDRMRKGLVTKPTGEKDKVGVGLKDPIETYLLEGDIVKIVKGLPPMELHELHFVRGYLYNSILNLMLTRFMQALAAETVPSGDPNGTLASILGTKPEQPKQDS